MIPYTIRLEMVASQSSDPALLKKQWGCYSFIAICVSTLDSIKIQKKKVWWLVYDVVLTWNTQRDHRSQSDFSVERIIRVQDLL
jgi:hypothetical protein